MLSDKTVGPIAEIRAHKQRVTNNLFSYPV